MGGQTDKLFLEVAGWPVVAHSWRQFDSSPLIDEVVLVARTEQAPMFETLAPKLSLKKPFRFAPGGKERQDSVWNGLEALSSAAELVAIHDGARPCLNHTIIADTLRAASENGAAVSAQRLTDTIKESADGRVIARHLDRSRLWSVQTPQCFRVSIIRDALTAVREKGWHVTDDTAACELIGQPVCLVENTEPNPKVTTPADLEYIGVLLRQRS